MLETLTLELKQALELLRARRQFGAAAYIQAKTALLIEYMKQSQLSACVVGISGGVDSAVTLGLLRKIMDEPHSPLKKIMPAMLPLFVSGATNQSTALQRGYEVIKHFGLAPVEIDLSTTHAKLLESSESALSISSSAWAAGQLVSYIRTPALYYLATLLTQEGYKAIVCGTTNRDEGTYLGFFGKASDGMVDVQLISDLHKSEVYQLAKYLHIPHSIQNAAPTGDTFDSKTDEEMLGVCYDFVELYLLYLSQESDYLKKQFLDSLSSQAKSEFYHYATQLESRHLENKHKYLEGASAIHFDIYRRDVPGGWAQKPLTFKNSMVDTSQFVGLFNLDKQVIDRFALARKISNNIYREETGDFGDSAFLIHNLLTKDEINSLSQQIAAANLIPADIHGKCNNPEQEDVNSYRASIYNEGLAAILFSRLAPYLPMIRFTDAYTTMDSVDHAIWRACGVNPLFRFICYPKGCSLIPHYDAGYDFKDGRKHTQMSMIIYLSTAETEQQGTTHLLLDTQRNLPRTERVFLDKESQAAEKDVITKIKPQAGMAFIFDHRILHEAVAWLGDKYRIVLRTDIVFERCGMLSPTPLTPSDNICELLSELNLTHWVNTEQVDSAYQELLNKSPASSRVRLAWKILRDPFYATAYQKLGSIDAVYDGGFFDDGKDLTDEIRAKDNFNWLITPVQKIIDNISSFEQKKDNNWLAVLATTGGMAPIHDGHIALMESAKKHLESQGAIVLGGYISPDHDNYVKNKCGNDYLSGAERLKLCENKVAASDWLMIDSWQIYNNDAVNFTTVIERLSNYLAAHVHSHRPIHVVYAAGGDNARLALAFVGRGHCIVIPRNGFVNEWQKMARHPAILENKQIFFASCGSEPPDFCSSKIRSDLKQPVTVERQNNSFKLYIRNEGDWAIQQWRLQEDYSSLQRNYIAFQNNLFQLFKESYGHAITEINILHLSEQLKKIQNELSGKTILSLDACIKGDHNLKISRCFPVAGGHDEAISVARPYADVLDCQFASLPPGKYVLLDDDIFSGKSLQYVLNNLPAHCVIEKVYTFLNIFDLQKESNDRHELCDSRDFLVGAWEAGLVIKLPNNIIARAPYVLPYVRPSIRLSLPAENELAFSRRIWQLNLDFYLSTMLRVKDSHHAFKQLAYYIGFNDESLLADLCQWHINHLTYCVK
jgi:NAD+ synthetase